MPIERVVIVYDYGAVNGGAAQVAIASALELARRGLQVDYFCAVPPVDARLVEAGIVVTCLGRSDILNDSNRLRAVAGGLWNVGAARALSALLAGVDPGRTIVHIHGWTKALSASVFNAARARRVPVLTTLHEYFTACPAGGFFDHPRTAICERRPLGVGCLVTDCDSRSYPHKLWRVARQVVAGALTDVHGHLADVAYISEFSRAVLQPYFSARTRWHFVPNPVDVAPCDRARAEDATDMLFVGRLSPEKGADLFCAAAHEAGVPAEVVGDGPQADALRQRWPDVSWLGWLERGAVTERMRSARALVLPSLWYETQGLVVQEALAQGTPVIVADRTAARDAVVDGVNGLLFRQGDASSLAQAMRRLNGDTARARRMSEAAHRGYWARPSTLERHVHALQAAYDQALAAQSAG